ncbi:MAG TPA: hypothetical protein VHA37_01825 [Candidatus Saccharimonadales bacterium]|nr:hypothetical protein [Candidatus Saccharimonadales bacterium]
MAKLLSLTIECNCRAMIAMLEAQVAMMQLFQHELEAPKYQLTTKQSRGRLVVIVGGKE